MEAQGIKVSREGGQSGTAEHPPTGVVRINHRNDKVASVLQFGIRQVTSYNSVFMFPEGMC